MLRFGPADGPVVVAAPALFEEGNRTRAFLVRILRLLAEQGVGGVLPDLPGQGESLVPTCEARLANWRSAFAALVATQSGPALIFAIRGGALVDADVNGRVRYHLSPVSGASLLRDLDRSRRVNAASARAPLFGGNDLSDDLVSDLNMATPSAADRTVRLDTDPRPADLKLPGRPLWRGSEPDVDEPLAAALAEDVAAWVRACAA